MPDSHIAVNYFLHLFMRAIRMRASDRGGAIGLGGAYTTGERPPSTLMAVPVM
jgi:hypothetical protein